MSDKKSSEKVEAKKKVSLTKKLKTNPWILSTLILGIIAILLLVSSFSMSGQVSKNIAGSNFVDFINSRGGVELEYLSAEDYGSNLYQITVLSEGKEVPVHITKDGKYFVQILAPIGEITAGGNTPAPSSNPNSNSQTITKTDVPVVELFIMTHCPYGTQAEKGLLPAIDYLGDSIDATIRFVHYFMHTPEETETPRQVCIREEQPDKWLEYLECFLSGSGTNEDALACDAQVGIDSAALDTCISSGKSDEYYAKDSSLSQGYGVQGSPTLVVNGNIISSGRDSASYLDTICQAFNDVPELCGQQVPNAINPSPGFGYNGGAGSATTAQC